MSCGKILYAVHEGTWVLRLRGDVRATWCASLDALMDRLLADTAVTSVLVDLREASNIDSTMLGILARLAVRVRGKFGVAPMVVAPGEDIRTLLDSMCLDKVFTIVDQAGEAGCDCAELDHVSRSDAEICGQVTAAHRVLMDLDDRNRAAFRDVVATLEEHQRAAGN